ncbi:MAG TPA: Calx-beta domain-containing protein [Methylophilaceae bacterium]|nr:Calx-beta domain-containing protein [Methylophilaceae bacterium]
MPSTQDLVAESNETVELTIGTATGTGTIVDNDGAPQISIAGPGTVNEAAGTITYTVSLTNPSASIVTVNYASANGSATAGSDYTAATGTLSFAPGETTKTITVTVAGDTVFEGAEDYSISLSAPTNATIGTGSVTTTITDDDGAPTIASVGPATVAEGGNLVHTVTLSNASSTSSSFAYSLTGTTATAGSDFSTAASFSNDVTLVGGNLIVPANVTSFTVTYTTTEDALNEATETTALNVGGVIGLGSITDNDATPSLSINDITVNEAAGTATFTVTLSAASGQTVTVGYNTSNGTATAGSDYTSATGSLTFTPGTLTQTITVPITNDILTEATERFNVNLVSPTNATISDALGVGTIIDNDAPPVAVGNNNAGLEDATYIVVTLNGTDADGTVASFNLSSLPANGALYLDAALTQLVPTGTDISASGNALQLYFKPEADFNTLAGGPLSFNFTAKDDTGLVSPTATETITITAVNDGAPVTAADNYSTVLGTPIIISKASLLSNDTLFDHAQITSITPLSGTGTLVDNGNGTYTYTPAATGSRNFTYTVTDNDGQTSTSTVTLTTYNTRDDLATVNESALAEGNGGGARVVTGNLLANDAGNTSVTSLTGATLSGGVYTVSSAYGTLQVTAATGAYTYTLNNNVDNDTQSSATNTGYMDTFTYTGNSTGNGTPINLRVNIVDDAPTATNATVVVAEASLQAFNIVMMLDVSGSMTEASNGGQVRDVADDGSATITTRLAMAKAGMIALVEEYFSQSSSVTITLATFSTASQINGTYTSKDAAITAINGLTGSGGTNYEAALNTIKTAFGTPSQSVSNISYFISDGAPNGGNTTNPVGASGFGTFVTNNHIQSYAIGIGSGIATTAPLNAIHNVDADGSGAADAAIIVADLNKLETALISTVPHAFGGNVVTSGGASNVTFGADGGFIRYIDLMLDSDGNGTADQSVRFTYNAATHQITTNGSFVTGFPVSGDAMTLGAAQGFINGKLVFDFSTGDYKYFTEGQGVEGTQFDIGFQVMDNDGDTANAVQTVMVVDGKPIAYNDFDTLLPNSTAFEGNVITSAGTDGSTGSLVTSFTAASSGADLIVDNAAITSITFKGVVYNLTANSTGSASGGTYTISNGHLTWTSSTEPANQLVFDKDGYYKYTPPAVQTATATPDAAVTTFFNTSANATANGVVLSGVSRTGNVNSPNATLTYNDPNGTANDGVGINSGGSNANADNLETLIIRFNSATHPQGVQNVVVNVSAASSNLGSASGTVISLTYSIYDISGNLLGQFASFAEGNVVIPSIYGNIGYIEVEANSAASARISSVTFNSSNVNTTAVGYAPEDISYTLTDSDGDASTATLKLSTTSNHYAGGVGADNITGSAANDYITGGDGNDTLNGGAGYDIIIGGAGNDSIDGGADNDQLYGGDGNDTINGGTGSDLIYGGAGNDLINGGDGADTIYGGAGNDVVNGGLGADSIFGGAGNDTLTGGGVGVDVFKWELTDQGAKGAAAADVITDFNAASASAGGDVLDLRDLLVGENHDVGAGNLASFLHFEKSGADTIVHISSNGEFAAGFNAGKEVQTITLTGVDLVGSFTNDQQIVQDLLSKQKLVTD